MTSNKLYTVQKQKLVMIYLAPATSKTKERMAAIDQNVTRYIHLPEKFLSQLHPVRGDRPRGSQNAS